MRYLYNILFYLGIPFVLLRLLWKSRHSPRYLKRLPERFGLFLPKQEKPTLWIHAVSVGEVIATVPLVKALQKQYPNHPIVMTTMTVTGAARAEALFADKLTHLFVPYDLPGAIQRFLNKINPQAVIVMETEIWPNFIHYCYLNRTPILLANARLSPRSCNGYQRLGYFMAEMLQKITLIAAQTRADAKRFAKLGARKNAIRITGSMKFDQAIPASANETAAVFRSLLGNDRKIWLAASTHEGEEELVLDAFRKVREKLPDVLLVIVPRHPERFSKVAQLCRKQGYKTVLRSSNQGCDADTAIFIGDSMGELAAFYAACDVTFVGGSLVPTGGHNLLEPAALGIPAITGPHVFNFAQICEMLHKAKAIEIINNPQELAELTCLWLNDGTKRSRVGECGRKVVQQNKGAVAAHLRLFANLIQLRTPSRSI